MQNLVIGLDEKVVRATGSAGSFGQKFIKSLGSHVSILLFIWSLFLAFEYIFFGPASYVRIHDNADGNLANRLALSRIVSDEQLGYWNTKVVSGGDQLTVTTGTNEPIDVLFFVLPGWLAFGLVMWLQRFVGGYFTFRLLKEI